MNKRKVMKVKVYCGTKGFTLIELLIVIVILGLLMSLVAPKMFSKVSSTKSKTAAVQMDLISTALDTFRLDMGTYPSSLQDLRQSNVPNWDGPYLPKEIPLDPWGNPYIYRLMDKNNSPFVLKTYGADGVEDGTEENEDIIY